MNKKKIESLKRRREHYRELAAIFIGDFRKACKKILNAYSRKEADDQKLYAKWHFEYYRKYMENVKKIDRQLSELRK